MSRTRHRNVDAFLATMRLLEQGLDPDNIARRERHESGACRHGNDITKTLACLDGKIEWNIYTPLRFAIPMLGKARYRPAIGLLSRTMMESPDPNCRVIAARALDDIISGPPPRAELWA